MEHKKLDNNVEEIEEAANLARTVAYNAGWPMNKVQATESIAIGTVSALIAAKSK